MTQQTILVIDDSTTIRKMVESHLSKEGYRVVLAPTAEDGLRLAPEVKPDVILLDHQLPGTTGLQVCEALFATPGCGGFPIIISSTLRKQAYVEYMDMANVVDSLPKPFTPDLLKTTIANAIANGAMIVASQAGGTAVPEVMEEHVESELAGSLKCFTIRQILDFINNTHQTGMVNVETESDRFNFHVQNGRIQAVVSSSVDASYIGDRLPASLGQLAPLLKFTTGTGFATQVDGLMALLDQKVLDPRMLKTLLRHQSAVLAWCCFQQKARGFSFDAGVDMPSLFTRSPLETSLAGLMVEAAVAAPAEELTGDATTAWVRCNSRGQNLDRTGLAPGYMKLLSQLESPLTAAELSQRTGVAPEELVRVLHGFEQCGWVERGSSGQTTEVLALETDLAGASMLRELFNDDSQPFSGRVVRDRLGMQLLLKRQRPNAVVLAADSDDSVALLETVDRTSTRVIVAVGAAADEETTMRIAQIAPDAMLTRPYTLGDFAAAVTGQTAGAASQPAGVGDPVTAPPQGVVG